MHIDTLVKDAALKYINNRYKPGSSPLKTALDLYLGNTTSLAVQPALDLNYAENYYSVGSTVYPNITSVPNLSFVRSGARTATGSDGVVREFASGVRRIVPGDGLRGTAGAVNLLRYSGDFSNAAWAKSDVSVSANQGAAPDNSESANDVIVASGSTGRIEHAFSSTSGVNYALSIFISKSSTLSEVVIYLGWGGALAADRSGITLDIQNKTFTNFTTGSGSVTEVAVSDDGPQGFYRVSIVAPAVATSATSAFVLRRTGGKAADGTRFYRVWGAQLETGFVATDYIPTTTASASAGADEETFDLGLSGGKWTNLGGLDPSAGFTVLVDAVRAEGSAANSSNAVLASLRAGSNTLERIFLYNISGREGLFMEAGDVSQAAIDSGVVTAAGGQVRMAARIATNNVAVSVNGGSVLSDTSVTLPDFTGMTLNVGAGSNTGVAPVNGFIRRIAIIPGALSDAHLQALTS